MNLAAFLTFLTKPSTLVLIEGAGNALITFAQHNKDHLPAALEADLKTAGADAQQAASVVQGLGTL